MAFLGSTSFSSRAWPNSNNCAWAHSGRRSTNKACQRLASSASHSGAGARNKAPFVKQGQCIAQRAAHRPHAVGGDVLRLQLVQPTLGAGKLVPHQAIEKIMQALPHRALLAAENKALVGFSGGQGLLWHKGHRRARWPRAGIERGMQSPPAHHLLRHLLPDAGPRR